MLLACASVGSVPATPAAAAERPSPAATAPTRTVEADGIRLGYRVVGRGAPIVLVTGLRGTMDAWDPRWVDALAAQGRRVVLLDNEGIGRSGLRPGPLTIRRMADDVATLMRRLRLPRADVAGWSMGGMIAQSLAVRHPRRVRRLVLLATAPGDGRATPPSQRALTELASGSSSPAVLLGFLFGPGAEEPTRTFVRNLALRSHPALRAPEDVVREQRVAAAAWFLGRDPDGRRIRRVRARTLVGGGEADEVLPVANQRHLARVIPHARLVTYADSAHGFFLQHRAAFLRRLDRFLG